MQRVANSVYGDDPFAFNDLPLQLRLSSEDGVEMEVFAGEHWGHVRVISPENTMDSCGRAKAQVAASCFVVVGPRPA